MLKHKIGPKHRNNFLQNKTKKAKDFHQFCHTQGFFFFKSFIYLFILVFGFDHFNFQTFSQNPYLPPSQPQYTAKETVQTFSLWLTKHSFFFKVTCKIIS